MPTTEEELADLKRQVAELKAEQARLKGEPPTPPRKPWPKWDPTEGMSMPPSALREMVRVVPERRDVANDAPRASSQPSPPSSTPPWRPQEPTPRGTGWADFVPITQPPGVAICDAMLDAQDRRDRAELIAAERARRQAIIDAHVEQKLFEKELAREQAERSSFHKAPGDPDFPARS